MTDTRSARPADPVRRRLLGRLALTAAMGALAPTALARPAADFNRVLPPGVAERGADTYTFATHRLTSADGERHYRVVVAVPRRAPPPGGYPLLYMLDGNAAMAELNEAALARLANGQAPVLVALGYDANRRFALAARHRDYTPSRPGQGLIAGRRHPERRGGGADDFLDLFEARLLARVEASLPVDDARRALWGHSFGGLFTLYTLLTRPTLFTHWYAASPSLYWNDGQLLEMLEGWQWRRTTPGRALLIRGGAELAGRDGARSDSTVNQRLEDIAARLDGSARFEAEARILAGANHGAMLGHSLRMTLAEFETAPA